MSLQQDPCLRGILYQSNNIYIIQKRQLDAYEDSVFLRLPPRHRLGRGSIHYSLVLSPICFETSDHTNFTLLTPERVLLTCMREG